MLWQYDHTARMLSGCTLHAGKPECHPFHLAAAFHLSMFLVIFVDIPKCCFFSQRSDGTRPECFPFSKQFFGICMCFRLIFPGEIQVDIRFLISIEAKERLKRNIMSFFFHKRPTLRAFPVRHIAARLSFELFHKIRIKIREVTMRTDIMCRQRIYFRNTGHRRNKRRTDRAPASYQIPVSV